MLRLRSLAVKLTLALMLSVLIAVVAISFVVDRAVSTQLANYVDLGMRAHMAALTPVLVAYYTEQGSWEGVEPYVTRRTSGGMAMHGRWSMMGGVGDLVLTDADGRVLVDGREPARAAVGRPAAAGAPDAPAVTETSAGRVSAPLVRQAVAVDDVIVGYLAVEKGPREIQLEQQVNSSIRLAGVLAGLAAVVIASILTRTILQPLRAMQEAARRVGEGDLAHRVPETPDDELGDLARQFNEMADSLQRQEELRRAMVADIAHELRTPIAVIQSQVEALQDGVFPLTQEQIVPLHDQTMLLGRLVSDLRLLALADAGQLGLERAPLALEALATRVAAGFASRAQTQGVQLDVHVEGNLPQVEADAQRIEQVLGNLLANALRHTPGGGSVSVTIRTEGDAVHVTVADTGCGIAPEDLPHVFDRFYRADPSRRRADGHTGLGLAIARQLAVAHGGSLTATSALGAGSVFTLRLPAHVESLPATT